VLWVFARRLQVANILKEERATAAFFKDFVASGVWHIDPKKGLCKTDAGRVEGTHSVCWGGFRTKSNPNILRYKKILAFTTLHQAV